MTFYGLRKFRRPGVFYSHSPWLFLVGIWIGAFLGSINGNAAESISRPLQCPAIFLNSNRLANVLALSKEVLWSRKKLPAFRIDEVSGDNNIVFLDSNIVFYLIGFLNKGELQEPAVKDGLSRLDYWLTQLIEKERAPRFAITPQVLRELKNRAMLMNTNANVAAVDEPDLSSYSEELRNYHQLYEAAIDQFYNMGLGVKSGQPKSKNDGIKDRRIVTQLLFTTHQLDQPLRFVTRDAGLYLALFRIGLLNGTLKSRLEGLPNLKSDESFLKKENSQTGDFPAIENLPENLRIPFLREFGKEMIHLLYPDGFQIKIRVGNLERVLQVLALPGAERNKQVFTLSLRKNLIRQVRGGSPEFFNSWIDQMWNRSIALGLRPQVKLILDGWSNEKSAINRDDSAVLNIRY